MLGESSLGEKVIGGEGIVLVTPPIIPEVGATLPEKTLVFLFEIDLFQPEDVVTPPPPEPDPTADTLVYGGDTVTYGGQTVGYGD